MAPAETALRYAATAPRGEVKRYPVGHFDIYLGEPFEHAVRDQTEFLVRHLEVASCHARAQSGRPLSSKVVAITGGARGIGHATARALAHQGARVAIGDLDGDLADAGGRRARRATPSGSAST